MRILIANSIESFQNASTKHALCEHVGNVLTKHGHRVDQITVPFVSDLRTMIEQVMSYRLLDVTASADRVIAFDAPSCLLRHPNKAIVISSSYSWLCELRSHNLSPLKCASIKQRLGHAIEVAFSEAKDIFFESDIARQDKQSQLPALNVNTVCVNDLVDDEALANQLALGIHDRKLDRESDENARRAA